MFRKNRHINPDQDILWRFASSASGGNPRRTISASVTFPLLASFSNRIPLRYRLAMYAKCLSIYYLSMTGMNTRALDRELKKGSAELLILSLLEARPRHGYELSKLIHTRSGGALTFHIDSLYPLLYRLEERGWIKGTWVEKPDERRRRFYKVTADGRRVLAQQRKTWAEFVEAVRRVTGGERA